MSSSDNKLIIRTKGFELDLEGRPANIRRAYRSLRTLLTEQFYETMVKKRGPSDATLELPRVEEVVKADEESDPQENFINLVVCEDIYNKMYLLDLQNLQDSFLGDILVGKNVRRIYIDAALEADFREQVDVGNTLWRELTAAGKAAVGRSD